MRRLLQLLTAALVTAAFLVLGHQAAHAAGTGSISGTVIDENNNPLGDVTVTVKGSGGTVTALTSNSGAYTVTGLEADSYTVRFQAVDPAYVPAWWANAYFEEDATPIPLSAGETVSGVNNKMALGGIVSGTVTGPNGETNTDMTVDIYRQFGYGALDTLTTDENGEYTSSLLPPGLYTAQFSDPTKVLATEWYRNAYTGGTSTPFSVSASGATVNARLELAATVTGTITGPGGQPLEDAYVSLSYQFDNVAQATTDADGDYTIRGLRPGPYIAEIDPPDGSDLLWQWYDGAYDFDEVNPINLAGGDVATVNAELQESSSISGTVLGPDGKPQANVRVRALGPGWGSARTATDGTYTMPRMRPGSYKVRFEPANDLATQWYNDVDTKAQAQPIVLTPGAEATGIDARLRNTNGISGIVRAPDGTPVDGAIAFVYPVGSERLAGVGYSNETGYFRTQDLPKGDYNVRAGFVSDSPYASQWYDGGRVRDQADDVTVATGMTPIEVTLTMGSTISGTVTDRQGQPLADTLVYVVGDLDQRVAKTDAQGKYEVTGVTGGRHRVLFYKESYAVQFYANALGPTDATPVYVPAGNSLSGIDAALTPFGSVSGILRAPNSDPTPGEVRIFRGRSLIDIQTVGADGVFEFIGLFPGEYRLKGTGNLGTPTWHAGAFDYDGATPITVDGDASTGKDITLRNGVSVSGSVRVDGEPAQDGSVVMISAEGDQLSVGITSGTYTFPHVAPGSYKVVAGLDDGDVAPQWWDGAASQGQASELPVTTSNITAINFSLNGYGTVAGTVELQGGAPAKARVVVTEPDGSYVNEANTSADGSYRVYGLVPGTYLVRFRALNAGYAGQWFDGAAVRANAADVVVTTGGETPADATLQMGGNLTGTVTDEQGTPLAGMKVLAFEGDQEVLRTVTDENGRYTFLGVDPGPYTVRAQPRSSHLDLVPTWHPSALSQSNADEVVVDYGLTSVADITAQKGATISGTVTDEDGTPVAGIGIDVFDSEFNKALTVWTDPQGRYTSTGLLPNTYTVRFLPGYYGGEGLIEQWWDDEPTYKTATPVTLSVQEQQTGIDAQLRKIPNNKTAPSVPRDVEVVPGDKSVTVRWEAPVSDGGLPVTRYQVRGTDGTGCATLGQLSCVISGLTVGEDYTFQVRAGNPVGLSPKSEPSSGVPFTRPDAPVTVTAIAGRRAATVSWVPGADNGSPISEYRVTSSSGATCTTTGTSCVVTGLAAGRQYTFTVTARNAAGESDPSAASNTVVPKGRKVQRPLNAKGQPPKRIKVSGITVLTGPNARTTGGQRILTRVSGGPTAQGEVRYFRIIRGPNGKVSIRTYGYRNLKVVLVQSARGTAEYSPYRKRTVYVGGVRR